MNGRLYDALTRSFERGPGARVRGDLLRHASGDVLEIGAGTGASLPHYPAAVTRLVLTEPDRSMSSRLATRLAAAPMPTELVRASATTLPFAAASFDTVVSTLVLCTVPDQPAALAEVRRVLRPGGTFLFLEHVRSDDPRHARRQDRLTLPWRLVAGGCHPNRRTLQGIVDAGFEVVDHIAGEMPGFPRIVRPYVVGRATAADGDVTPKASATSS